MGKNKNKEVEAAPEPVAVDKTALKEAKKAERKAERAAKRETAKGDPCLSGPPDSMVDAELYLAAAGIPSGLTRLKVTYDGGKELEASSSQFSKTKAAHRFLMAEPTAEFASLYGDCTLIMLDPDAPEREGDGSLPGKRGPWLHWLVTNCKGTTDGAFTVSDYLPPAPALGVHRYIFLLCKGVIPAKKSDDRIAYNLKGLIDGNGLTPVAANFFYCSAA